MHFISSSLLVISTLILSSFVSAEDSSYAEMRQVTVPGVKSIKKRTDEPQKEEIKKPSPPPVRAASNFGGANNTGKRSIFDFDEEDFDLDWARRRGVKVDPQAAAKGAAPNGAAKPAADPFANLRKATEELSKKINMDDLLKNDSLKDIVKPIADAAANGNKDDALKSIRQKSQELLNDPNTLRELTENLMKDPGMKKIVDQFNPAAMKDSPFGDLFGGKPSAGPGAGAGWEELLKGFGAPPKAGAVKQPFAGLEDLFGDLFAAPKGKQQPKINPYGSDDSFDRRYNGQYASMFRSDSDDQEL